MKDLCYVVVRKSDGNFVSEISNNIINTSPNVEFAIQFEEQSMANAIKEHIERKYGLDQCYVLRVEVSYNACN